MRVLLRHVPKARWFALLVTACATPPSDPLDPVAVDDAAKAQGDAMGDDRSGSYLLELTSAPDCDCPTVYQMDLCTADVNSLATAGGQVTLSQTDGYLLLTEDQGLLTLSGALTADGDFDLAAIQGFGSVLGEVALYIRLTGRFTGPEGFTGEVHSRALGNFDGEDIDCRTAAGISGVRTPP